MLLFFLFAPTFFFLIFRCRKVLYDKLTHTHLLPSDRSSRGDDGSVRKLRTGKSLSNTSRNLLQLCRAVFFRYAVYLVQHDDHGVRGDFSDHNALGGLGLDALVGIDNENYHVDDLGPANDRADEGGVAGAIH